MTNELKNKTQKWIDGLDNMTLVNTLEMFRCAEKSLWDGDLMSETQKWDYSIMIKMIHDEVIKRMNGNN